MADLSKITGQAVLEYTGPNLSKLSAWAVLDSAINASKITAFAVLDGTQTVPTPPGGGSGGHGGGNPGGNNGKGGGKGNARDKALAAKAWAKGYFSSTWLQTVQRRKFIAVIGTPPAPPPAHDQTVTRPPQTWGRGYFLPTWLQVIARRRGFAVVVDNTTPTPTPDQNTRPSGGAGHHRPIKFRDRFYHPVKDRYALANDFQAWLEEKPQVPESKPLTVKVQKKTVILPEVELTPEEVVDFEAVARELNLKTQVMRDYIDRLKELAHRIQMEDEAEAIALLLVA